MLGRLSLAAVIALVALAVALGLNLWTYTRLTNEEPVAELAFVQRSPQLYTATITTPDGAARRFELAGDEWQLDARFLKWKGWAFVLGFDPRYRLERLSGRYDDIDQERSAPRSVYALTDWPSFDLWAIANTYPRWIPLVDAVYGSATYLPMADGAHYEVSLTPSGILARPLNTAARSATHTPR